MSPKKLTTNKKILPGGLISSRDKPDANRTAADLRNLHLTSRRCKNKIPQKI
jgi:hypothetical protein